MFKDEEISKKAIRKGIMNEVISFGMELGNLVAIIGEYWFYICSEPDKTSSDFDLEELVEMVFETINSEPIKNNSEEESPEWLYYQSILEFTERIFYHVTLKENLDKILKEGLIPQIGDRALECGDTEKKIYLFPTLQHMNEALGSWLGIEFETEEIVSLLIRIPKNFVLEEGEVEYEVYSKEPIPKNCIMFFREE